MRAPIFLLLVLPTVGQVLKVGVLDYSAPPVYSAEARSAGVQGAVTLAVSVGENGLPVRIEVISPLGFGLDEEAVKAVSRWRWKAPVVDGKPVPFVTAVMVNFRLSGAAYDEKAEKQRAMFNSLVPDFSKGRAHPLALQQLERLASEKYPPAMHYLGVMLREGTWVPADATRAERLIEAAAKKEYGPAVYEMAKRKLKPESSPDELADGIRLLAQASRQGSTGAQLDLANRYESGIGVEPNAERARTFYRMCAARKQTVCQYRLGRMLLDMPDRTDHNFNQGMAWLEVAAAAGFGHATQRLLVERPKLTAEQAKAVESWREKLSKME
jgi:TonB family protein